MPRFLLRLSADTVTRGHGSLLEWIAPLLLNADGATAFARLPFPFERYSVFTPFVIEGEHFRLKVNTADELAKYVRYFDNRVRRANERAAIAQREQEHHQKVLDALLAKAEALELPEGQ